MNDDVILVNEMDTVIGEMGKMDAHKKPVLHRAFSVFIFNDKHEMLLQKRAKSKYHSAGLWTNACCSHPRPGEETLPAAQRRLNEELGFQTPIKKIFDFIYKAEFENGLYEFEFDHVFVGEYNGIIKHNPEEVSSYCYKEIKEIKKSLENTPHLYTAWFQIAFPKIEAWIKSNYQDPFA